MGWGVWNEKFNRNFKNLIEIFGGRKIEKG